MRAFSGRTVANVYGQLIEYLKSKYATKTQTTRECNDCVLTVREPSLDYIRFPYRRKLSIDYAKAELEWYWSGNNSCKAIGEHASMWLKLTDDGVTSNSAYGYILEKKYGFDQIQQIIRLLKDDPESRRAVLNISDPAIDRIHTKDMQCTIALQFLLRNNKLNISVYMRSNDVFFGLPYDYIYFISLQDYIARQLHCGIGTYTHHAGSMHMYDRDIEKFNDPETKPIELTGDEIRKIVEDNYENKTRID